jgi:aminoglycoside phosphotransferase (APT) family kinase protein
LGWLEEHLGLRDPAPPRRLSGGNSNLTLCVTHAQGEVVIRRPPENAISDSAARGIRREAGMLQALAGRARVPALLAFCEDASVIGQPFAVVQHIAGYAISTALPTGYPPGTATLNRLGEELVDAIAEVHTLDPRELALEAGDGASHYVTRQVERWRDLRLAQSVRPLPLVGFLADWLLSRLPPSPRLAVMHGDYHLDNTLCHPQQPALSAIIDWELSTVGNPLADVALMLAFWGERTVAAPGFGFVQQVSRGLPGLVTREALALRWSRATQIPVDDLDYYLVFALWRLASIVEGAYVLYRQGKVNDDYSRNLERDVPSLLEEAAVIAGLARR